MATIKDIAKLCNVSVSTVSYALRYKESTISETTKQRIRKVASDLNYVPNAHAVRLKKQETHQIGIFVPGFQGHIHPTLLAGIATVVRTIQSPYNMIVTFCDDQRNPVTSREVDLAIVMDPRINDELIQTMASIVPVITFDKEITGNNIYTTILNQGDAIKQLTQFYINQGFKRIGFIQGSLQSHHNTERFNAYKETLNEASIALDDNIIYSPNAFTVFKGHEVIHNALNSVDVLPFDALIACNDELAIGAMNALSELGFHAPTDYQLSGFDNIIETDYQTPTITSVAVDWFQYGIAIGRLALRILNEEVVTENLMVDCSIVYKESTKSST